MSAKAKLLERESMKDICEQVPDWIFERAAEESFFVDDSYYKKASLYSCPLCLGCVAEC